MSDQPRIEVLEERHIDFYGDTILAVLIRLDSETVVAVPVRPLCAALGITWSPQRLRIMRDEVLSTCVIKMITQVPGDTQRREHLCLPLDYLHGWLFGITTSQVKAEHREKITLYRRECFRTLSTAFQADLLLPDTHPPAPTGTSMTLAQVRELGLALQQMAEQQMALEGRVDETHQLATRANTRLDKAAEVIGTLQRRVNVVEDILHPHAYIDDEQVAHLSATVKALGELLTSTDKKKNHYQGVFSELYRRFGVSGYKLIRREQYDAVLAFLADWRQAATQGGTQPPTA